MPVVVSMLNSYSEWAACRRVGLPAGERRAVWHRCLVGSSGAYLSYVVWRAMNRSFASAIGGFGTEVDPVDDTDCGQHREIDAAGVTELLAAADSVIITSGCGMAVPRCSTVSLS